MLTIVNNWRELNMRALKEICVQSCMEAGARDYPDLSENQQLLRAQEDLYQYLRHDFFSNDDAFYALWSFEGRYTCALRMEPYRDGLVLSSLETAPDARGKGHAKALVAQVLDHLADRKDLKVYSHIDRGNQASIAVHMHCGFIKIADHAVYIDGSVSHRADTYLYELK